MSAMASSSYGTRLANSVSKNNRIVYLAHPAAWYTAEGGVTALDTMISDLESSLLK